MAVVEMRKLTVIGLNSGRTPFIHELMHLGVVEINSQEGTVNDEEWMPDIFRTSNSADVSRLEADIARVSTALEAINRYDTRKKPLFQVREEIDRGEFVNHMNRTKTETEMNVDTAVMCYKQIADGQNEVNRLKGMIAGLKPWEGMDIPLEMKETKYSAVIYGTVGVKTKYESLLQTVLEKVSSAVVQQVSADTQQIYISIICLKEEREQVYEALREFAFNPVSFAEHKGTPREAMKQYETQVEENRQRILAKEAILSELSVSRSNIEFLYDSLNMRRDRAKIVGDMLSTEMVFYFDGWVPKKAQAEVEALLQKYEFYYNMSEPEPEDEVPVCLNNGGFSTPFEAVTNMYSLPTRHDIDPTALLAPFYFIFFGMMLSDAAYGIIMAVGCWIILKKYKLEGMTYRMIKMFFYCGISTFMWGALFGGWFGDFFTVAAKTLFDADFVIKPIWFDPLTEPMKLLIFSLILGAIHLFVGMGIQAYMLIRDGHPFDALFDIGFWYVLLIGLVLFGIGDSISPVTVTIGEGMAIVGAVGILLTGGRSKKGIFGKITGGLGSLYGITSYLSDVLSYSRLLALGLATGVVAKVINTLGSLAGGGIKGAIILLIAFVFGTIFNIAINALGAFVHSCRLQYVEFFGKFYTGGGRPFAPFERRTKYIKILKEEKNNG
ncbi:V-type ATP synthase subunit I [Anaerotignum propionicum]|jgi:V/A-type H+-transporting ATPase subunit I|uniref:V-type ATP synthase subunit I n=1 Tax=Anaerotignum propionicum TaxID=28446 RepID=UPI0028997CE3|nr:V-type ATP synthase subunit I [Anaerotignum propionicum]